MLSLPPTIRIYLAAQPADLRKSFDSLAALVRDGLQSDPLSGDLFVFRNKSGDRIKLLIWEEDGYAIWYKKQTTDYPRTYWWNTPTVLGHNRLEGPAPTRGAVPTATGDYDPRRITMLGRTRPTTPPRPDRPADDR